MRVDGVRVFALFLPLIAAACGGTDDEGSGGAASSTTSDASVTSSDASTSTVATTAATTSTGSGQCGDDVAAPDEILPDTKDPEAGDFTLDEALVELPEGPGPLRAIIDTEMGEITCELYDSEAPTAVANFVGLARGRRPWKDPVTKEWVKRKFYDGLTFHRIIDDFMSQGGDPLGTGFGGPGYKFDDEVVGLSHVPGVLSYANSGPNTNGSQFFITETAQTHLDADFTIMGLCGPLDVIAALCAVPTDAKDKPIDPVHTLSVKITRCAP